MNDHLFLVSFGFKAAASVMPYSGGDFVIYQRERNIFQNQSINLFINQIKSL